jgi:hypothetical protein
LIVHGKFPKTADVNEHRDGGHLHYFTCGDVERLLIKNTFKTDRKKGVFGRNFLRSLMVQELS